MQRVGVIIFLLILLIAGGFLFWQSKQPNNRVLTPKKGGPLPKEVQITLDKNGFTPQKVTIKAGTAVRWKNVSGDKQTVNSDNYPSNQLHKELNFGVFNNNSSVVYVFTKPGTYGYHNQFTPKQQGTIVVTE